VTTRPNDFMAPIHDRMPVIIPPDGWATWLDAANADPAEVRAMLEPREDVALDAYEVSDLVNSVRNDGPALILPADTAPAADPKPRDTLF
jgi:putative SOS response-associated peptidase YedK